MRKELEERVNRAVDNFMQGYGCCQSVVAAFADIYGLDDNMAAGPASYGMTDTLGRMHSDAQFAGSSSVPAHVEMMGFLGMGNNPMVGASVAVAVAVAQAM